MREELADGRVKYSYPGGRTAFHTPVPGRSRGAQVVRPPGSVRVGGRWYAPLTLLGDDERVLPATYPFRDARRQGPGRHLSR